MKTYTVKYNGNNSRFRNLNEEVSANTMRDAVIKVYADRFDDNYFPQDDGRVRDCDGEIICDLSDESIFFDGGYLYAEEIKTYTVKTFESFKAVQKAWLEGTINDYAEEMTFEEGMNSHPSDYFTDTLFIAREKCGNEELAQSVKEYIEFEVIDRLRNK